MFLFKKIKFSKQNFIKHKLHLQKMILINVIYILMKVVGIIYTISDEDSDNMVEDSEYTKYQ